jgi:hypothetical protein
MSAAMEQQGGKNRNVSRGAAPPAQIPWQSPSPPEHSSIFRPARSRSSHFYDLISPLNTNTRLLQTVV